MRSSYVNSSSNQVRFYRVSLECPAAPKIGCGSAAKPILLDLERQSAIREAWLNREGTMIAVVPKDAASAKDQSHSTARVFTSHERDAKEITGAERDRIAQSFASHAGWLRGAQVDQLSMEEAGIIAERMLGRVQKKTPLAENQTSALRKAFKELIEARFIRNAGPSNSQEWHDKTLEAARPLLDRQQLAALDDALRQGFHPQPGEE